jgi:hypothetical protein
MAMSSGKKYFMGRGFQVLLKDRAICDSQPVAASLSFSRYMMVLMSCLTGQVSYAPDLAHADKENDVVQGFTAYDSRFSIA